MAVEFSEGWREPAHLACQQERGSGTLGEVPWELAYSRHQPKKKSKIKKTTTVLF